MEINEERYRYRVLNIDIKKKSYFGKYFMTVLI